MKESFAQPMEQERIDIFTLRPGNIIVIKTMNSIYRVEVTEAPEDRSEVFPDYPYGKVIDATNPDLVGREGRIFLAERGKSFKLLAISNRAIGLETSVVEGVTLEDSASNLEEFRKALEPIQQLFETAIRMVTKNGGNNQMMRNGLELEQNAYNRLAVAVLKAERDGTQIIAIYSEIEHTPLNDLIDFNELKRHQSLLKAKMGEASRDIRKMFQEGLAANDPH